MRNTRGQAVSGWLWQPCEVVRIASSLFSNLRTTGSLWSNFNSHNGEGSKSWLWGWLSHLHLCLQYYPAAPLLPLACKEKGTLLCSFLPPSSESSDCSQDSLSLPLSFWTSSLLSQTVREDKLKGLLWFYCYPLSCRSVEPWAATEPQSCLFVQSGRQHCSHPYLRGYFCSLMKSGFAWFF